MIKKLIADSCVIEKYDIQIDPIRIPNNTDYVIFQAGTDHPAHACALLQQGFEFLDRVLLMEINMEKAGKREEYKSNPECRIERDDEYSPEMYILAQKALKTDRRFHLEPEFNDKLAAPIISAYIDQCKLQHMPVYKAKHFNELLGYTIVDEYADDSGDYFENVLGVTMPGIKGKMIAGMLYSAMMEGERRQFKKYFGRISAANIPSINMHFQLGGKVVSVCDEYIYRVNGKRDRCSKCMMQFL